MHNHICAKKISNNSPRDPCILYDTDIFSTEKGKKNAFFLKKMKQNASQQRIYDRKEPKKI